MNDNQRLELRQRINQATGLNWADSQIERRPSIALVHLTKPGVLDKLLSHLKRALAQIPRAA